MGNTMETEWIPTKAIRKGLAVFGFKCKECGEFFQSPTVYCPECGRKAKGGISRKVAKKKNSGSTPQK